MLPLAFCGDDCNLCPRYIATQKNDRAHLSQLAQLWQKFGWRDSLVPPEEMACGGCRSSAVCAHGIRECALEHHVENCGECRDYPCDKIQQAFMKSDYWAMKCREICSKEDFMFLRKAFFSKRDNLDSIKQKKIRRITRIPSLLSHSR